RETRIESDLQPLSGAWHRVKGFQEPLSVSVVRSDLPNWFIGQSTLSPLQNKNTDLSSAPFLNFADQVYKADNSTQSPFEMDFAGFSQPFYKMSVIESLGTNYVFV